MNWMNTLIKCNITPTPPPPVVGRSIVIDIIVGILANLMSRMFRCLRVVVGSSNQNVISSSSKNKNKG